MNNEDQKFNNRRHSPFFGVFAGILAGGLAGAITALLLAPQSGEDTRIQIRDKSIELRDQATGMMSDAISQIRSDKNRFAINTRQKSKELIKQGQDLVVEQLDRVSDAAQAGKKAIQAS